MEFYMEFVPMTDICYSFQGEDYHAIELHEGEPQPVYAKILDDGDMAIGEVTGFLLYNETDFFARCDCVSGDCCVIAEAVCKKNGAVYAKYVSKEYSYEQIFILDKIHVDELYRNKGIATAVIKNLPSILTYEFSYAGNTIFLYASDYIAAAEYGFDSEEYRLGTERLKRFYQKLGYKTVKGHVMYWKNS